MYLGMANNKSHKSKMIEAIFNSWEKCPELRFGQLIVNAIRDSENANVPLFYIQDHDLESMIIDFANKIG
jgi:hypothetical protein